MINGWRYYNHAALPLCAPHENPDLSSIQNGLIWKKEYWEATKAPLLVRWTSDWDCGRETNWWYVIKDTPLDVSLLKSKRRYEITKGKRNFEVKQINPRNYINELFDITVLAYEGWDEKYRPQVVKSDFEKQFCSYKTEEVFAAFNRESGELSGYAIVSDKQSYAEFSVLRTNPQSEHLAVNASIVAGILEYYSQRLVNGFYICDGSRAISHETKFQDYLEKYFSFRKAYCTLHVKYKWYIGLAVKILYPMRSFIKGKSRLGHLLSGVLKMEEMVR